MNQPELGQTVAELRKKKGMTQEELADKCTINIRSIQRIEAGEVNPRAYTKRILAAALEIEDKIFTQESAEHQAKSFGAFLIDLITFRLGTRTQLKIAWLAGLIGFASTLSYYFIDLFFAISNISPFITKFAYAFVVVTSFIAYGLYYRGFAIIGKETDNSILLVCSYIFIAGMVIGFGLYSILGQALYSIPPEYFEKPNGYFIAMGILLMMTSGILMIFWGVGIKQMEAAYGKLAGITGILNIIVGASMVVVILIPIAVLLATATQVLQIILLHRAYSMETQPSIA